VIWYPAVVMAVVVLVSGATGYLETSGTRLTS
jgi:hypothetical protein